ncbi:MAG: hypothetical protein GOVbin4162_86 [Prokaryotic dsDNA virus sp.]|nr:MAG: hypothetical protein GOVbin4162_86 [Prokaryotic dsDNA virus sp.]
MSRYFDLTQLYVDILQNKDETISRLQEELAWSEHEKEILQEQVDLLSDALDKEKCRGKVI